MSGFLGGGGGGGGGGGTPTPGALSETTQELELYVDGTGGDDANDGYSAGAAKETLSAALDIIPFSMKHNVAINVTGDMADQGDMEIDRNIEAGVTLTIGGDTALAGSIGTVSGPFTADITNTPGLVESSTASFSYNALRGYLVKYDSGGSTYDMRTIHSNDLQSVTPVQNFQQVGATLFSIVRPSGQWSASTTKSTINIRVRGGGIVVFNRFRISGTASQVKVHSGRVGFSEFVNECDGSALPSGDSPVQFDGGSLVVDGLLRWNNDDANFMSPVLSGAGSWGTTDVNAGIGNPADVELNFRNATVEELKRSYVGPAEFNGGVAMGHMRFGSTSQKLTFDGFRGKLDAEADGRFMINDSSDGYGVTGVDGYFNDAYGDGYGLIVRNFSHIVTTSVDVSNNTNHGVFVESAKITFRDSATGSDNEGLGLYAYMGSSVTTRDGYLMAISGDIGEVGILDPLAQDVTWQQIDDGYQVSMAQEATTVREVE